MTPLEKARTGQVVTLLDKIQTISTLDELQGFVDQVRRDQRTFTKEEHEAVQQLRARYLKGMV